MRKNRIIIFLCIMILLFLTGCNNEDNSSNGNSRDKVMQELDYLDTQIVSLLNKLNNISLKNYTITSEEVSISKQSTGENSQASSSSSSSSSNSGSSGAGGDVEQKESESQGQTGVEKDDSKITVTQMTPKTVIDTNENEIDWQIVKSEIEMINSAWAIILLDLSSLNVDNKDILEFSATLDESILSIKSEDKTGALTGVAKLYAFIPKYETAISAPNSTQNIKQVKSSLINAYSVVEQEDWESIQGSISECEKTFRNLINDLEYVKNKEYKVNRTYILVKELQNSLSYRDKKLFYIKYKDLIESINTL